MCVLGREPAGQWASCGGLGTGLGGARYLQVCRYPRSPFSGCHLTPPSLGLPLQSKPLWTVIHLPRALRARRSRVSPLPCSTGWLAACWLLGTQGLGLPVSPGCGVPFCLPSPVFLGHWSDFWGESRHRRACSSCVSRLGSPHRTSHPAPSTGPSAPSSLQRLRGSCGGSGGLVTTCSEGH